MSRTSERRNTGLIVALDHANLDEADSLAQKLAREEVAFKVGLTLFAGYGPEAIRRISRRGPVFCDLKLHDIPQQVETAAGQVARLGIWMLSVHSSGGSTMIRRVAECLRDLPDRPFLGAVTVLTSLSPTELSSVGQGDATQAQVTRLARLATAAGADAVICSPLELANLRSELGPEVLLVTPGVRPAGSPRADQFRVMTPAEAASSGADHIVVGRPITAASDPLKATQSILHELRDARG